MAKKKKNISKKYKVLIIFGVIFLTIVAMTFFWEYKSKINPIKDCYTGERTCTGLEVQSCYDGSAWNTIDVCEDGCSYGYCLGDALPIIKCGDGKCDLFERCSEDCGKNLRKVYSNFSFSEYNTARRKAGISDDYIKSSMYYDYTNPLIKSLNTELKTDNVEQTIRDVVKWTYKNIDYDTTTLEGHLTKDCMESSASDIIERGFGLCSTQSRVNIAILRGMGLASRAVSGCMKVSLLCKPLSIIPPKFIEEDGRYVTLGGAHAWVEIWLPYTGWTIIESTNGKLYSSSCFSYDVYDREPISQTRDICSLDFLKAMKCKDW